MQIREDDEIVRVLSVTNIFLLKNLATSPSVDSVQLSILVAGPAVALSATTSPGTFRSV